MVRGHRLTMMDCRHYNVGIGTRNQEPGTRGIILMAFKRVNVCNALWGILRLVYGYRWIVVRVRVLNGYMGIVVRLVGC